MRRGRLLSLALGALVLGLVGVAVRDIRIILRLSHEEELVAAAKGSAAQAAPAQGAHNGGDPDLVWVGGNSRTTTTPSSRPAWRTPTATTTTQSGLHPESTKTPMPARPPDARGQTKLSEAELQQLAVAAKHFDQPRTQAASHSPSSNGRGKPETPNVGSTQIISELEKMREQLDSNDGTHRGALAPTRASAGNDDLATRSAECQPGTKHASVQSAATGVDSGFSCDWASLGRPTVVLDPSAPLTYAFLKYRLQGAPVATQCEQPTAQVLGTKLGYTDVSRSEDTLASVAPTFTFPRGAAVGGSAPKNSYIGKVTNSWLLGGPKYIQYRSFRDYAVKMGCLAPSTSMEDFKPLPFMPEQYILTDCIECKAFFDRAHPTDGKETWFLKTGLGPSSQLHAAHGISLHRNLTAELQPKFGGCVSGPIDGKEFIVQGEVQPLLLNGRKFDFRSFLLVGRTSPMVSLYHPGMLRVAPRDYHAAGTEWKAQITNAEYGHGLTMSPEEHYWTFSQLQAYITEHDLAPPDHVDRIILKFVKAVMRFVSRAVGPMFGKGKGAFHVFALDFVVGADLHPRFLEANEAPAICSRNEPGEKCLDVPCSAWLEDLMTEMEQSKIAVVRSLAEHPAESLRAFQYGYVVPQTQFEVVYNALHDRCPSDFLDAMGKENGASWDAPNYCELF